MISDDPQQAHDYGQGYRGGQKFVAEVIRKRRRGIDITLDDPLSGPYGDLIELAAQGYVPEDLLKQIDERVPAAARQQFELGFRTACSDWIANNELGAGEN